MSKEMSNGELQRLLCERILNESWSVVSEHKEEIRVILERGTVESDSDLSLLFAAAEAFIQRTTMIDAENQVFEEAYLMEADCSCEKSPCGRNLKSKCPCNRKICLLVQ
jgi:hypothetical protein